MAWQVLAMWLIVSVTLVWFIRDEKQARDKALQAQALRFAYTPHYRRPPVAELLPPPLPTPAPRTLATADRAFFRHYLQARD